MSTEKLLTPTEVWSAKIYSKDWKTPGLGTANVTEKATGVGGVGISGNGFGHSTLTNADQFCEWQWITTRAKIPAYPF